MPYPTRRFSHRRLRRASKHTPTRIAAGSNFFGTIAINGQSIRSVTVGGGLSLAALEQVRIGGIGRGGTGTVVTEPSTYAVLGTGLAGLVGLAWRRRQA